MTRIIAGRFRGRRLMVPSGRDTRPTTDRMRERLFAILEGGAFGGLAGARVADLYAGTGALGLEALSRGAAHVSFVEKAPAALKALQANLDALGVRRETRVHRLDASRTAPPDGPFDLILMDPPYHGGLAAPTLARLAAAESLASGGLIALETGADEIPDTNPFHLRDRRRQGRQQILLLSLDSPE
ncbi:16S rRNA (guanine(966)-N(2))-methyltransferase RsmD [Yunchengibacter salinarum]|uniref:16S rRNA (guanine(966)-N(2))-methyltransferase RsmD n=1 Tax=Yunchengibacter salinarum TaxID=3133399 RepID=UPI0035B612AB